MKILAISVVIGIILFQDVISNTVPLFGYFDEFLVVTIFISGLIKVIINKEITKSTISIFVLLSLYSAISIFSSINSNQQLQYTILGLFLNIKFFLIILGLKEFNFSPSTYIKIVHAINIYAILACIFAIIDLVNPYMLREFLNTFNRIDIRSGIISVQSFFVHPGVYGWFMIFTALLNFFMYEYYKKNQLNLFLCVLFLIFALLSLRFKVVLGILLLLTIKITKTSYHPLIKVIPGMIIIFIYYFLNKELIGLTIERYITADVFVSARKALYVFSPIIAAAYFPFGSGIGTFGSWYSRENYSDLYFEYNLYRVQGLQPHFPDWITDTYWPSILAESGFIGFTIIVLLNLYILLFLFKKNKGSSNDNGFIYITVFFVMVHTLIDSMGEQIYNSAPQFLLISILVGISFGIQQGKIKEKQNEQLF